MKSYGLCNFVESLFSYVVLIFRETLFTCFTWNYMMPSILKNQGVFKINVFSHCFPIKRKSSYDFVVTAWFLMWTSLGLNQGPPDYESDKIWFHGISLHFSWLCISLCHRYLLTLWQENEMRWNPLKCGLVFARCSQKLNLIATDYGYEGFEKLHYL